MSRVVFGFGVLLVVNLIVGQLLIEHVYVLRGNGLLNAWAWMNFLIGWIVLGLGVYFWWGRRMRITRTAITGAYATFKQYRRFRKEERKSAEEALMGPEGIEVKMMAVGTLLVGFSMLLIFFL
jgi:hypothetical protein